MSRFDKAIVIICLGKNPYATEKTLQSLVVCSGILDYFRAIHGKGYLMTINFSGTKLLQAKTPEMAEDSLRDDCNDWAGALQRAQERLEQDAPPGRRYRHCEIVLVGTDEVPSRIEDAPATCQRLKLDGIRVNSVVVEPARNDEDSTTRMGGWRVLTPSLQFYDDGEEEEGGYGMVGLARATGGLTLEPNSEGKLAVHQLFGEMFRRWGKDYWDSSASRAPVL